jgi:hypothetical protein
MKDQQVLLPHRIYGVSGAPHGPDVVSRQGIDTVEDAVGAVHRGAGDDPPRPSIPLLDERARPRFFRIKGAYRPYVLGRPGGHRLQDALLACRGLDLVPLRPARSLPAEGDASGGPEDLESSELDRGPGLDLHGSRRWAAVRQRGRKGRGTAAGRSQQQGGGDEAGSDDELGASGRH